MLADGEVDEAVKLAERLLQLDKTNRNARLVLGVRALKQKQYQAARQQFAQAVRGPITDLTATLLTAWTHVRRQRRQAARSRRSTSSPAPDWYGIFKDLHAGLILDLAGNRKEAGKRFERAYKLDADRAARRRGLWQLGRRATRKDEALKIYSRLRQGAAAPSADHRGDECAAKAARSCRRWSTTPQAGAAEVLYGLGAALGRREEERASPIAASSICSSRSISSRRTRWRCCRSPISTRR